jgi:uncharacterized membrane protein YkvA (DUF1232 family)
LIRPFRFLARLGRTLRAEALFLREVLNHPRTPRRARVLLWLALAYALSPVDLIPDWIPLLGQMDDLVIIPLLAAAALWMTPREVVAECRAEVFTGIGGRS